MESKLTYQTIHKLSIRQYRYILVGIVVNKDTRSFLYKKQKSFRNPFLNFQKLKQFYVWFKYK